ncbi:MAG: pyrroline-5-carboxylate reductase, partial [Glaciecola sp.]
MQARKLSFIGAGNMPRSIISGLVNGGYDPKLIT